MPFSRSDLTNAGIPQNILIETLYQVTVRRKDVLETLPRRAMIGGVRNRYPAIKTLGDLFDYTPDTKPFRDFKAGILAMASQICAVDAAFTGIKTIPSASFSTLEEGLRAFLPAYCDAKLKRAELLNLNLEPTRLHCSVIQKLFDEHTKDNSRSRVAGELKTTKQNLEDKLYSARDDFNRMFFLNETPDNIEASPLLVKMVRDVRSAFGSTGSKTELARISGIKSPRMLEFLALILGITILESGTVVPFGRDGAGGSQIILNKGRVKTILKQEGIPISFSDFRILMSSEFKDNDLRSALEQYARSSEEFEVFTDKAGIERIAVKWEHLKDLTSEIIRILYDNDAWGVKNAMDPKKLRAEWERRAKLFGKKTNYYGIYTRHWRLSASRNGFVMLRWSKSDEGFLDGKKYVSRLLYENPDWTLSDVLNQAKSDGYAKVYAQGSLKTYYSSLVKDTRTEQALVAAVKILDYAPGKTLPFQDIVTEVQKTIDIQEASIRKWILRNGTTFSYFSVPGKRAVYVKLLSKKAALVTPYSSKGASSSAPVATSAPVAPAAPKSASAASLIDWGATTKAIISMVPETSKYISLVRCFDKALDIMKDGASSFADNNIFISWLRNIADFPGMTSWDKDSVRANVLRAMETYVTNFYKMKTGGDLRTDIMYDSSFYTKSESFGLGTKVKYLRHLSILPSYGLRYSPGSLEEAVCKACVLVVKARNELSGHPDTLIDMSETEKQVCGAMLLILYLATKL